MIIRQTTMKSSQIYHQIGTSYMLRKELVMISYYGYAPEHTQDLIKVCFN